MLNLSSGRTQRSLFAHSMMFALLLSSFLLPATAQTRDPELGSKAQFENVTPSCSAGTFTLTGNSGEDGPDGNIATYSSGSVSVKASAFSRRNSDGLWQSGFLGQFGSGLGVTDVGEGSGGNGTHRVDNEGDRKNYVLFEFNTRVTIDRVFLDSVVNDSDITVWYGTATDPYNNHLTLSDGLLSSFSGPEDNDIANANSRWADVNSGSISGNVFVVAASISDATPEDNFKVRNIEFSCPSTPPPCVAGPIKTVGSSGVSGPYGNTRTFTNSSVQVNTRAFSRRKSDGLWQDAFLGAFGEGLGVTDRGEGDGSGDTHKVDNIGDRLNYVVFEFQQPIIVDRVYLNSVSNDSDIMVWIGNASDPFNNPITPSDALLTSFGAPEINDAANSSARWADINATAKVGNVLIVAAKDEAGPEDAFKIEDVDILCAPPRAQVTIIKEVLTVNGSGASTVSFPFTATRLGTANFSLIDNNVVGPDRFSNNNITAFGAANAITVTENIPIGWTLSDLFCVETGGISNSTVSLANRRATIIAEAGETIVCTFRNSQLIPSSANAVIAGRVLTADGAPVARASVTIANLATGESITTITNHFGYYRLEADVMESYTLTASHKWMVFENNPRVFTLTDDISSMDFIQTF